MQKQGKKGNGILSPQAHCHLMVVKEEVDFTKGMVMLFGDFFSWMIVLMVKRLKVL
jgi:hypothetical protein